MREYTDMGEANWRVCLLTLDSRVEGTVSTFDHDKRQLYVLAKPSGSHASAWNIVQISVDTATVARHPEIESASGAPYGSAGLDDMAWAPKRPKLDRPTH